MAARVSLVAASSSSLQSRRATSSQSVPALSDRVGQVLSGQAQAQVVLGQEDPRDVGEDLGFVLRHPQQLRGGEAGHGEVAGDGGQARLAFGELPAGILGASVVPQNGRAQHGVVAGEQRRTVHLAR